MLSSGYVLSDARRRTLRAALAAALATAATLLAAAPGQAVTGSWQTGFGLQGAGNSTYAAAVSGSKVYVGGSFTTFGGQPAGTFNDIAVASGSRWSKLGTGLNGRVNAIAVLGGNVYAGGDFTTAGGSPAAHFAMWDGHTWSSPGAVAGTSATIDSLATDGTSLYIGGQFDHIGGLATKSIAKYTPGVGFSALDNGVEQCPTCGSPPPGTVKALLWSSGTLWVGGSFAQAGTVATSGLASWNGSSWTGYGAGVTAGFNPSVESLAIDSATGDIYVGGHFDHAGTTAAIGVAKLSGGTWSALGDILNGSSDPDVNGLAFRNGVLTATGLFTTAGGVAAKNLASLSGGTWSQAGGGLSLEGRVATLDGTRVLVAGDFDGNATHNPWLGNIGLLSGNTWRTFGQGLQPTGNGGPGQVYALESDGSGGVYATGTFLQSGPVRTNNIGDWQSGAWHALRGGLLAGGGQAAAGGKALLRIGSDLYICGSFDHAGLSAASNIVRWDGSAFHGLGTGLSGGTGGCDSLATLNGKLYAGGMFGKAGPTNVTDLAVRDLTTGSWAALPGNPTVNGTVEALTVLDDRYLVIGGNFTTLNVAGDPNTYSIPHILLYDTQSTAKNINAYAVIGGTDGTVYSLWGDSTGDLYVGGQYSNTNVGGGGGTALPAANIALWQGGVGWSALGSGTNGVVYGITPSGSELYATGIFTQAGGVPSPGVAGRPLDGSADWSPLSSGGLLGAAAFGSTSYGSPDGRALLPDGANGAWVGGQFVQAGNTQAGSFAHFAAG